MKRMRKLEDVLNNMRYLFEDIEEATENLNDKLRVQFVSELNVVQTEWVKKAVDDGILTIEQGFKMLTNPDHEIQLSVFDQMELDNFKILLSMAYERIDGLVVAESRRLFKACLDAYRKVYY